MLQTLLHIIIVSFTCITWGLPLLLLVRKKKSEHYWYSNGLNTLIFLFFAGLLTLSLVSSWVVLFLPLKFSYFAIATLLLLAVMYFRFPNGIRRITQSIKEIETPGFSPTILLFTIFLLCVVLATIPIANGDTQIYHLQIVRWTNEYGTVPGTANIYPRLGLGSAWFNLVSLFYIPGWENHSFSFLNATVAFWFVLWLINKFSRYYKAANLPRNRSLTLFYFLLIAYFLYDWQLVRDTANSTGNDFIVTALTLFCISFLVDDLSAGNNREFSFVFILISISTLAFKLSGLFILVPCFFYLLRFAKPAFWIKSALAGCVIMTPVFIKNYIITGYPLFPIPLSLGSPDWQLPVEMTTRFQDYIQHANKFYNHQQRFIEAFDGIQGVGLFNWIPFWIKGILLKHKILLLLTFLSPLLFFFCPPWINRKRAGIFLVSVWIMAVGWFFTAPDIRFAFGFILVLAFLPVCIFAAKYISPRLFPAGFMILSVFSVVYLFKKASVILNDPGRLLNSRQIELTPLHPVSKDGIPFYYIEPNRHCNFSPLPCLPEKNPFVQPRGSRIKDGFMMKLKPDDKFAREYNY